jgi:hypothetical protein
MGRRQKVPDSWYSFFRQARLFEDICLESELLDG